MVVKVMQRWKVLVIIGGLLLLVSCKGEDKVNPADILQTYIDLWEQSEFTAMYSMLTAETKEQYSTDDFIERYEKIYSDLQIDNLNIAISPVEYDSNDTTVSFPIEATMESIAGQIEFTYEITVESFIDKEKEIDTWLIDWDPGLIFPQLVDGGKIRINKTEPSRGEILDRNEMPLAINDIAYEVGIVPEQFVNKDAEIEQLASLLHLSTSTITNSVEADWVQSDHFVPLRVVPNSDEKTLAELRNIPSVVTRETTGRTYPSSKAVAHLIGYIGKITEEELKDLRDKGYNENDMIGKRGLERLYEDRLKGKQGVEVLIESEDEKGDTVYTTLAEKPVENGEKIQLTIDINLQELLFNQYEDKLTGAAAAIHPNTGEVLALVSTPSFDPIQLAYGISQSAWDALMNDKNKPFVNRFTATFAPGSVIKPVVGAIGLKNNSITHDEQINIEGLTWKKDNWEDFHVTRVSTSNGPVTLEDALVRSDNIYFAMKAVAMGNDKLVNGLQDFGFDEQLPLEYPFTTSQISNSGSLKNEALRANTGYGQGELEVNVLHMALLYSPFLNDGNLIKPVLTLNDQKGEIWKKDLVSEDDITKLKKYLQKVVTDGTATVIKDNEVEVSGKTGTAELKATREEKGHSNGWFVGYPTKDEDIIIAMLIENAENIGTSSLVAEKVADVLSDYKKLNN